MHGVVQVICWLVLKEIKSGGRVETSESNEFVRERLRKKKIKKELFNIKDGDAGSSCLGVGCPRKHRGRRFGTSAME